MITVYANEEMPDIITRSLFLAGPSLRPGQEKEMVSWRKEALRHLEELKYDGVIFIPENRSGTFEDGFDYNNQIAWEEKHLNVADCIVFYVPRDLSPDSEGNPKMAALTTNVEFGAWADTGKIVFGAPDDAAKNNYLKHYAKQYNVPTCDTLRGTLMNAIQKIEDGFPRKLGERYVPLMIWNTDSFQSWYKAHTKIGNRLDYAQLKYNFRPRNKDFVFMWVMHVDVYVAAENRNKSNEFVLSRTDTSAVLLYNTTYTPAPDRLSTPIVLVREFRSPVNNKTGFVYELPGGSSVKPGQDPKVVAAEELHEELGLQIDPDRLRFIAANQVAGTLSSHKCYLYAAEISRDELDVIRAAEDSHTSFGNSADSEITYPVISTPERLMTDCVTEVCDWATLGQVMMVISQLNLPED